jgi:hypothetical protein
MSKYRNKITFVDGLRFASKKEAARYTQLKLLSQSGCIQQLELQVKFPIAVNGVKVCVYIADFVYVENNMRIVEDVKGVKTAMYRLKKKLMKAVHGVDVRES